MDEVDRIVEAWQRERPDLDVAPMQVFSRLTRLAKHVDRMRKSAFSDHGLETWEFDVLAALKRSGDPYEMSPGQLVTATYVTSGTMTNRVDRLVERGLVERRRAETDRRGVLVRLTPEGSKRVDAALGTLLHHEQELLTALGEQSRTSLADALRTLTDSFSID